MEQLASTKSVVLHNDLFTRTIPEYGTYGRTLSVTDTD